MIKNKESIKEEMSKLNHYLNEIKQSAQNQSKEHINANQYREDYAHLRDEIYLKINELKQDIVAKVSIRDLCRMVDYKANIKYVDSEINQLKQSISSDDLLKISVQNEDKEKQGYILDVLLSENCVGKWVWKSGDLKSNKVIPWELQISNTNTQNQTWQKDASCVMVHEDGLYELTFGFWSKKKMLFNYQHSKKPAVQIYVNGEIAITATQQNPPGTPNKNPVHKHNQNITGLTHIE